MIMRASEQQIVFKLKQIFGYVSFRVYINCFNKIFFFSKIRRLFKKVCEKNFFFLAMFLLYIDDIGGISILYNIT